jgi:hypothetical protein
MFDILRSATPPEEVVSSSRLVWIRYRKCPQITRWAGMEMIRKRSKD